MDTYENLEEHEKINASISLKKEIRACQKKVASYLELIDAPVDTLSESEDDGDYKLKGYMDEINKIKLTFSEDKNLTIDDKVVLFVELTKYTTLCEEHLSNKKELNLTHV